ncbi:MAG TPA: hypothetical protein VF469_30995 [Kofleriaceae bacterium]
MTSKSTFLVAAICAAPLSIAACGGSSDGAITPAGPHHGYVVSSVSIPTSDKQATDFGLDLGSKTASKQDGMVDNKLGEALSALAALNFNIQGTVNTAVDQGSLILLIDLQTKDFASSDGAGFSVKIGATPMPAPCNGSSDTVCRHHLDGTGMFTVAASSPTDAAVAGKIASGTFNGGPGDVTLQLAIGSTTPIELSLLHARVKATSITDAGMTAIVGGLVTQAELTNSIGPAIQVQVAGILDRDCPVAAGATRTPPMCGCKASSTGATVVAALDGDLTMGADKDCVISTAEVLGFPLVAQLLLPDSCSTDSCKTPDSISIGIKAQAVKATFPM